MSTMPSCQACGGAIRDRPATAALAPDGHATWWVHRDLADCLCAAHSRLHQMTRGEVVLMDADDQRLRGVAS